MLLTTLLTSLLSFFSTAHSIELLLPRSHCDQFVEHQFYSVCYSNNHRQAIWTTHLLFKESIRGRQRRTNDFRENPLLNWPVGPQDFKNTGFDRGHLVPAGDMKYSHTSMSETFLMSNMSPQLPGFNRNIWGNLEQALRQWVLDYGNAYVVTAPILSSDLRQLPRGISVPHYYYKIAYFPERSFMIAFLFEHREYNHNDFSQFAVSVDYIEYVTGIDFFSQLDDQLEEALESQTVIPRKLNTLSIKQ